MRIRKILKIFMVSAVLLSFLFAVSFTAACSGTETTDEVTEEEAEIEEEIEEKAAEDEEEAEAVAGGMKIESAAFEYNEMIPADYTCDGADINPPLTISGIPSDTKSLVLIVDDPDAPGGTWAHWTVWNIDPATTDIPEDSVPSGSVEGVTDSGEPGYRGPCPPPGTHHYFFKLYATDTTLDLDASASVKDIEQAIEGHIIDSAELVGLYGR